MADERIIKKYPNRRLYDTAVSRYITLADVRELVMSCTSFKVIDTANDHDITRAILLQIMLEEESGGEPLFSATMLSQIIRFYGGTLQGTFARYLEGSLDLFSKQHQELVRAWGESSFDTMTRMAQHQLDLWGELQGDLIRAAGFDLRDQPRTPPEDTPKRQPEPPTDADPPA